MDIHIGYLKKQEVLFVTYIRYRGATNRVGSHRWNKNLGCFKKDNEIKVSQESIITKAGEAFTSSQALATLVKEALTRAEAHHQLQPSPIVNALQNHGSGSVLNIESRRDHNDYTQPQSTQRPMLPSSLTKHLG